MCIHEHAHGHIHITLTWIFTMYSFLQTNESVIDLVLECDRLGGSLTNVRRSEPVIAMAAQLMDACIAHLKNNLVEITRTEKFLSLGNVSAFISLYVLFLELLSSDSTLTDTMTPEWNKLIFVISMVPK